MIDSDRETACAAPRLPESLVRLVAGYRWARDRVGESGGAVYRLHGKAGADELYLKHGSGSVAGDITDEMVRLRWLARYLPVPAFRHFVASADEAWLLTARVPGWTAYQLLEAEPAGAAAVVDALADFLGRLHAIPVAACPFNADAAHRMRLARARIDAGLVEEEDFDEERQGWTGEQVWDALSALLPLTPDPVVTHGDFSLDNLLIEDGVVTGCIDLGRVGIADRWQDLAILWSCLGEFDKGLQARLLARYGIADDAAKRRFHLLLDELF